MGFFGMSTHDLHPGSITDIEGITVGHAAVRGRATGCSVVLCPEGAVCGAAVRGGAPGTRETDLLRPENTVQVVHAVLLTGGSAFGLDAAGGVMRWLDERGHGLPVGAAVHTASTPAPGLEVLRLPIRLPSRLPIRVPIVPAAVLFDLWIGDARIRPDAGTGYAACEAASSSMPAQGSAGAGLGATVGKLFGIARAMRGGIGTASVQLGGFTVGALVAVNAIGDVLDASGRVIAGARSEDGRELVRSTQALLAGHGPDHLMAGMATTIGVVATDALLSKAQVTQLAAQAHHGLSRAVSPITVNDGDAFFALATGAAGDCGELTALAVMTAEAVSRAIRNAVLAARALADPNLPDLSDLPAARDWPGRNAAHSTRPGSL